MHWLDFSLIVVLGIGALLGLRSGLLWQLARVAIFVAAIYGCVRYHGEVGDELEKRQLFDDLTPTTAKIMAVVVIFLGVILAGWIIAAFLERLLQAANLKLIDRLLGAVLVLLVVSFIAGGVLTTLALYGGPEVEQSIARSHLAPVLLQGTETMLSAVPGETKQQLQAKLVEIKKLAERYEKAGP